MIRVHLIGRLGSDATQAVMPSGSEYIRFDVACDDSYFSPTENRWIDRAYWVTVEITNPSLVSYYQGRLTKGTMIFAEGKLITYTFVGQDGTTKKGFRIQADIIRILKRPAVEAEYPTEQMTSEMPNYEQLPQQRPTPHRQVPKQPQVRHYHETPYQEMSYHEDVPLPSTGRTQTPAKQAPERPLPDEYRYADIDLDNIF